MTQYQGNDNFSDGQIYDLQDPVLGGIGGQSNIPLEALFDRTTWLKNRLGKFIDVKKFSANATVDSSMAGQAVNIDVSNGNVTLTIQDESDFPTGFILPVFVTGSSAKYATLQTTHTPLYGSAGVMYLYGGESVLLVWGAVGGWAIVYHRGNLDRTGDCLSGYVQRSGTLIRNGQLVKRTDFPRLWAWANANLGGSLINDMQWNMLVGSQPVYQGCFSTGDGSTTFRLPDDRGCFDRYLDQNRGLDVSRTYPQAGGYEADMFAKHNHTGFPDTPRSISGGNHAYPNIPNGVPDGGYGLIRKSNSTASPANSNLTPNSKDTDGAGFETMVLETPVNVPYQGGAETTVKNVAKLPLIIY